MTEPPPTTQLECPGCGSSSFTPDLNGNLTCDYCHTVLPDRICPTCGAFYEPGSHQCPSCGADLVLECPACGAPNPPYARQCVVCGQEMDILDTLFTRVTGSRADWLRDLREEATKAKAQQEAESQARLADMWAAEARYREALAQSRSERERQQRIIVTVTISIVAVVVLAILITLAIAMSQGTNPHVCPL